MENIKITTQRLKQKTLERFAEKKQQKPNNKKRLKKTTTKAKKQATNNLNAEQSKLFAKGDKWEELE